MAKQMTIEMVMEYPGQEQYYYADLELPAMEYEIRDALQRARDFGQMDGYQEVSVLNCDLLPALVGVRLDSPTLDELNFFAKRLDRLNEEEQLVLRAVTRRILPANPEGEIIGIKDLINCTYGLDQVMIASNVGSDEQLGQFVIDNDLHEDVASVPNNALYLLDRKQIGRLQRENEGGVFLDGFYVVAGDYEMPEIYDGKTLPYEKTENDWVFSLRLSKDAIDDPYDEQEWVDLPLSDKQIEEIKRINDGKDFSDMYCHAFLSTIPQIQSPIFSDMQEFYSLNTLARRMAEMFPDEQIKFKAALTAEQPHKITDAVDIAMHLDDYELSYYSDSAASFYKDYLRHFMDSRFDGAWLDTLLTQNEGERLLQRLGAAETPYGVISARGHSLYELVSYDEPEVKELSAQDMTDEKLDVIEVLDRRALFANGRLLPEEIPEGLYAYDLRESDDGDRFISIEPKVGVNHGGTVLMKEMLDFGERGYIPFDEDSDPNFLGYTMTPQEFAGEEQAEEENQEFGGMQL